MTEITIEQAQELQRSNARQIQELLQKQKELIGSRQKLAPFKQPLLLLARRSGDAEIHENATKGRFEFMHSDGSTRFIILSPSMQVGMIYAGERTKIYLCHEDYPLPVTHAHNPLINSDELRMLIEKSQHDLQKLNALEKRATGDMYFKILAGIAVVILAIMAYKLLVPGSPEVAQAAINTVKTTAQAIPINTTAV